jgi:hypothetical protein
VKGGGMRAFKRLAKGIYAFSCVDQISKNN